MRPYVVTVTYGSRSSLLHACLTAARDEGLAHAVVVDNGSRDDIATLIENTFGDWATVVRLNRNEGSAKGFKSGIERALDLGAQRILLLDDDNVLCPGSGAALEAALDTLVMDEGPTAVFGVRADHAGDTGTEGNRLRGSFCHFHILDLWSKIRRRIGNGEQKRAKSAGDTRLALTAPYGGLLFDRALIGMIGLPDERYVLYQDDSDFTYRIVRQGGHLLQVMSARIDDAERSWNAGDASHSALKAWVTGPDFRVYYAFRNHVYWDVHGRAERSLMLGVNLAAYVSLLFVMCLKAGRLARFGMLMTAMKDGFSGKLGIHPSYPIPT